MNKALERPQSNSEKIVYRSPEEKAEGTKKWEKKRILKLRNGKILEIGKKEKTTPNYLPENNQNGYIKPEVN